MRKMLKMPPGQRHNNSHSTTITQLILSFIKGIKSMSTVRKEYLKILNSNPQPKLK